MYNNLPSSPDPLVVPIEKPITPEKPKEYPSVPNPFLIPKPLIKPGVEPSPKA
ncbi:MAG: hypothetical protein WAZ12_02885 [Candidatus Absconditicoccaceae bacterium]